MKFVILLTATLLYCIPIWEICPPDTGGDYECPISHPITPGFDKIPGGKK